jgi:hypothetical protein
MNNQHQPSIQQQLHELDELYYNMPAAVYETTLQSVTIQLQQVLPDFTVAFAEIYITGTERQAHGGMRHVLAPVERSAQ